MKFPYLLRPDQLEVLQHLNENDHLIYVAGTGSGKSLLFQKYVFDRPATKAVLISPLNALSRQQSERFEKMGIRTFQSEMPSFRDSGVWILSPEKLEGRACELLKIWGPHFLIVDEAHCIWEWGDTFRPSYRKVFDLLEFPSLRKTLWCSATLPPKSRHLLRNRLNAMGGSRVKEHGFFTLPSHLSLEIEKIRPEIRLQWLRNRLGILADQSGMIFCNTRASAESLQRYLNRWGVKSVFYHAGLSIEEKLGLEKKLRTQQEREEPIVVVATSAFGMGMDYSFFRFCILFEPPFTLLALVQAIGRIGRVVEGKTKMQARAYVLWHPADFHRNRQWIDQQEVQEWCRTLENPVTALENYFKTGVCKPQW